MLTRCGQTMRPRELPSTRTSADRHRPSLPSASARWALGSLALPGNSSRRRRLKRCLTRTAERRLPSSSSRCSRSTVDRSPFMASTRTKTARTSTRLSPRSSRSTSRSRRPFPRPARHRPPRVPHPVTTTRTAPHRTTTETHKSSPESSARARWTSPAPRTAVRTGARRPRCQRRLQRPPPRG